MSSSASRPPAVVLTTVDSADAAIRIARVLVDERLAACVNILPPMTSVYRWKGVVEEAQEQQLIIKTTGDRLDALHARIKALHTYEVPEFLVLAGEGSDEYLAWIADNTRVTGRT